MSTVIESIKVKKYTYMQEKVTAEINVKLELYSVGLCLGGREVGQRKLP